MKEQEYNNSDQHIIDMLTPKVEVKPSSDLRERILQAAAQQSESNSQAQPKRSRSRMSYWLGAIGSAAAVVAIAITLTFNTPAYAARKYFSNALIAVQDAKTMVMQLMARTAPNEPIDYFNPSLDFIPATIKVIYNEPMLWSIEKQNGRNLLYKGASADGNFVYEWLGGNEGNVGWKKAYDGSVDGDLAIMLDPRELLKIETRIAENRKAFHDYFVEESFEAGISLVGTEVKALRQGGVNLKDAWCSVVDGELYVNGMHISPYEKGNIFNRDPLRVRRLLMHKREIMRLLGIVKQDGYSLIPLSLYFKGSRVKVQVGLCRGKKLYDKREDAAKRDMKREAQRGLKEFNNR